MTHIQFQNHCLIIPKRHIKDYFELNEKELIACNELIKIIKDEILKRIKQLKDLILEQILVKFLANQFFIVTYI